MAVPLIVMEKTAKEGTLSGRESTSSLLDTLPLKFPIKYPTYIVGIKMCYEELEENQNMVFFIICYKMHWNYVVIHIKQLYNSRKNNLKTFSS